MADPLIGLLAVVFNIDGSVNLTLVAIVVAALGTLATGTAAGMFIKRGTLTRGIEIMDRIIDAYETDAKLAATRYADLEGKLTTAGQDKAAMADRMRLLEQATAAWVLEKAKLENDLRQRDSKIAALEAELARYQKGPSTP
ncbi:MAG: hypothetical protein KGL39_39175 [Patescibacteria group bacterium]|nr:hypothetical protein [Patescibacteria group bacterium]